MADQGYRVNLYGAGGDEVLAGYAGEYFYPYLRYLARRQWAPAARCASSARSPSAAPGLLGSDYLLRAARAVARHRSASTGACAHRGAPGATRSGRRAASARARARPEEIEQRMVELARDQLLNYWLRIDSQNSMTVPLELRTPYLDYRVVEFAFALPLELLIRDGWMKWILRKAMDGLLPPEVIWRRKKGGFPFPIGPWLLRHEARILAMAEKVECPYLDLRVLASEWKAMAGRDPDRLWSLVSLALWWKKCIQGDSLAV
jgi:asparagine synthase (glutamine-hydrolysing)